jgi:uncharacterized protein YjbI with pentapeptide repeats
VSSPDLQTILSDHAAWLTSHGKSGARAELAGIDLRDALLQDTDLRRANLNRANLSGSDLFGASFRGADLQGADLTGVTGLGSQQVSGANLSGAKLSETSAIFDGLDQVRELSKNAGTAFVFLLFACLYSWVTIATTTDATLLTNFVSSPLPVIQAAIPLYLFYLVAPLILFALYLYLHLQLHDLWQEVADLPSIFPDGRLISQKIYPWQIAALVRSFPSVHHKGRSFADFLEAAISRVLTWWLAPLTLALFWLRYLPRHDWSGALLQVGLLGAISFLGAWSLQRTSSSLSHDTRRSSFTAPVSAGAVIVVAGLTVSYGAIAGIDESADSRMPVRPPDRSVVLTSLRTAIPMVLPYVGQRAFADMKDTVVSGKPSNLAFIPAPQINSPLGDRHAAEEAFDDEALRGVVGANLQGKDLKYANARGAFLVRADLHNANLHGADLSHAYLQQAYLESATLTMVYLSKAHMEEAHLKAADLQKAYLGEAELQRADLRSAQLTEAILVDAHLQDADLRFAHLDGAMLSKTDLANAKMFGATLCGANLEFAQHLTQAQINEALTDGSTVLPVGIVRSKQCAGPPKASAAIPQRCETPAATPLKMHDGVYTITLKSDSGTCAVVRGTPGAAANDIVWELGGIDKVPPEVQGLTFTRAVVGRFYTLTPIPPGAPDGTEVLNIPPGDGRSGYFKLMFVAPERFSSVHLEGRANVDDTGRVFLNGTEISPSVFSKDAISEFGNARFYTKVKALFMPGALNVLLVSDVNTGAGPSGAAFWVRITFQE